MLDLYFLEIFAIVVDTNHIIAIGCQKTFCPVIDSALYFVEVELFLMGEKYGGCFNEHISVLVHHDIQLILILILTFLLKT